MRTRRWNETTHDADAVCEKLEGIADSLDLCGATADSAVVELRRIATALERLAGIPAANTTGTLL